MEVFLNNLRLKLEKKLTTDILNPDNECILWTGSKNSDGYGILNVKWIDGARKQCRAHRLAYMIYYNTVDLGPQPQMEVSHICHVKNCLNPKHLVLEPHYINMSRQSCRHTGECLKMHTPFCMLR